MGRRQRKKTTLSFQAVDEVVSYTNERHQNYDGEITVKRRRIVLASVDDEKQQTSLIMSRPLELLQ